MLNNVVTVGTPTSTGGKVLTGSAGVKINDLGVSVVGDQAKCTCGAKSCRGVGPILQGSPRSVKIGNKLIAMKGDPVDTGCGNCFVLSSGDAVSLGNQMSGLISMGAGVNIGQGVNIDDENKSRPTSSSGGGCREQPVEQVEQAVFANLPPLSASVVEYEKKHSTSISSNNQVSAVEHTVSSTSDSATKKNSEMKNPSKNQHFYYTPFRKNVDVLIYEIFGMFDKKRTTTSILFSNPDQAELFTKNLEIERDLIIAVTARNRGISEEDADKFFDEVNAFYQSHQQIKYNKVNSLPPIVHILGHGSPEADSISSTSSEIEYVFTFELVKKLKNLGLPTSSTIELDFCWSACERKPEGITKEEAVKHIINNDFEFLFGDPDNCFLGEFFQEIKSYWPEFQGEIVGYYGSVMNTIQENVLSKDGSWGRSYATEIELEDGVLLINKDDFKKTILIV